VSDRRRYPRVQADVVCRPAGVGIFHHARNTRNISLGGVCVFSDQQFARGTRLDLDVLLPDGAGTVRCWAEVVWAVALGPDAPARFDVGLRFTDMAPSDVQRLAAVLVPAG
jgi:PilZ domain